MKKELIIQAKLDSQEFDASFARMNQKLKEAYSASDLSRAQAQTAQRLESQGFRGLMSPASKDQMDRDSRAQRRELDAFIRDQSKQQEKAVSDYKKQLDSLREMRKEYEQLVKLGREDSALKEKIANTEKRAQSDSEQYRARDRAINQALDDRAGMQPSAGQRMGTAFGRGGFGGAMRAAGRIGPMGLLGMAMPSISGLGTALQMGSEAGRVYYSANRQAELAAGSAAQNLVGRDVNDVFAGRTSRMQIYAPERARAIGSALAEERGQRRMDTLGAVGSAAGIGAGAYAGLAAAGAATGGAALVAAGVIAAGGALYKLFTDDVVRNKLLGSLGPEGNRFQRAYEMSRSTEMAKNMRDTLEAMENQDPLKKAAMDEFYANYKGNLAGQRRLGLSDADFYNRGGFLDRGMQAGFTREDTLGASDQILGAGGSTRMARSSLMSLRLMRNMDLTNAGQIMGQISGTMGSAESTKQATISIIAEGMRIGLDKAEFAEEQRRFVAAAADVVSRSGARSLENAQMVAGGLSPFMTETTTQGIAAGRAAYEELQGRSNQYQGPRGAMQAAAILRDENLKNMTLDQRASFASMSEEQIRAGGAQVEAMAQQSGLSLQDFQARAIQVKRGATFLRGDTDKSIEELRTKLSERGLLGASMDQIRTEAPDVYRDLGRLQSRMAMEDPELNKRLGTVGGEEFALGMVQPARTARDAARIKAAEAKAEGGVGGRVADMEVASEAASQQAVLRNFATMRDDIARAATESTKLADNILAASMAISQALQQARDGKLTGSELANFLQQQADRAMRLKGQPQAGQQVGTGGGR